MIEMAAAGPAEEKGPLPAFFYFALSAEESLLQEPFNRPVEALKEAPLRCYSFSLPYHEGGGKGKTAIEEWGALLEQGNDFLTPFFHQCAEQVEQLVAKGLVDPEKIAAGGLSRGGFAAAHLAALEPRIKSPLQNRHLRSITTTDNNKDTLSNRIDQS